MTNYKALPQYTPFLQSFDEAMILTGFITLTGACYTSDVSGYRYIPIKLVEWENVTSLICKPYLTLSEAALVIAQRLGYSYFQIEGMAVIFLEAIEHRELDPRHPFDYLPLSKSHSRLIGDVRGDWLLSTTEVGEFAIHKGWPEDQFSDLLNKPKLLEVAPKLEHNQLKLNEPKRKDAWCEVILVMLADYIQEFDTRPSTEQAWARLIEKTPKGYVITKCTNIYKEICLEMPSETQLSKDALQKRLKRYTSTN